MFSPPPPPSFAISFSSVFVPKACGIVTEYANGSGGVKVLTGSLTTRFASSSRPKAIVPGRAGVGDGVGAGVSVGAAADGSADGEAVGEGVGSPPATGSVGLRPEMKRPMTTAPRIVPITAAIEMSEVVSVGNRPVGTTRVWPCRS